VSSAEKTSKKRREEETAQKPIDKELRVVPGVDNGGTILQDTTQDSMIKLNGMFIHRQTAGLKSKINLNPY
jgi:hypothetical protein